MAASLIRTSARAALRTGASATPKAAGVAGLTFARGKATLPDLAYDYGALEPSISGKIMELHHKNHHQTYVNSYNAAIEQLQEAVAKEDIAAQINLKPLINFHGGGHINHTLFWENLAPKSQGGGEPPSGALAKAIDDSFGNLGEFQSKMNAALAGIQGSGWAWLVKDKQTGNIGIKTYANQDPVVGQFQPLLGIDAWEHAYYLQYQNRKAEYFSAIWDVINWKAVEKRFSKARWLSGVFAGALRPKKSRQVLRKASAPNLREALPSKDDVPEVPSLTPWEAHRLKYREANLQKDTQLGEVRDHTAMLHSIGVGDLDPSDPNVQLHEFDNRPPGEPVIASLTSDLWAKVAEYLNPAERASLAFSSRTLYTRLGREPWITINLPENHDYKADFLISQDRLLPHHLLCFPCGKYHRRTQEGCEKLEPADLVMRAYRFGPSYGIPPDSLCRRWRRDGWYHQTRYHIHHGRLLMRVVSTCFADPGLSVSEQRLLLYSRDDYWPYFSVCAHWRDGELMNICKCALGHIPVPRTTNGLQGLEHRAKDMYHRRIHNPNALTSLCGKCRPMRRCPECPSEYLVEVKLTEDRSGSQRNVFRHAIVVTRWTDLGDGRSPRLSREWAAINGDEAGKGYDSFAEIGKRAISGIFESAITDDTLPGQRILSMNPKGKKLGEAGNTWY
ncbi:F-box domain protein [Aspergillus nomiae NRRL 13137]|uniref:superoxide dismutase n=1 Tax=Aspergillus nomiae NRRL (strain ATCC 15546 / NRRL 13137 / CBS 260.88 / M93) TaxID=1509407 RepID=A0A0L1IY52_ASPN3|nr:F-box domain protein [Aspergillus nomiae NRRL 13137]KNG84108.1 F-box domain protein [Aspergillus nomiae NRRL 13137]